MPSDDVTALHVIVDYITGSDVGVISVNFITGRVPTACNFRCYNIDAVFFITKMGPILVCVQK